MFCFNFFTVVVPVSQTQKLTLPAFSDYIIARLNSNDSHLCWNKMIEEAAYFYLGKHPNIGKDNGTGDYKTIGQKMVQTFPSVGRPGAQPWVWLFLLFDCFIIKMILCSSGKHTFNPL